jgi:hypothetical protein
MEDPGKGVNRISLALQAAGALEEKRAWYRVPSALVDSISTGSSLSGKRPHGVETRSL